MRGLKDGAVTAQDPANEVRARARRNLAQTRYLQTRSGRWSGTVKLPV
ncbi:hypothetical protein AB0K40_16655 [Nonomuraea bangladeshensis]|uniref:Integrase n=1 Tax=Nonomuraea bangladeshensis TaxID=404385 RepID=A0ABV3H3W8_9ACTN